MTIVTNSIQGWRWWPEEVCKWSGTISTIKNGAFKAVWHAIDWASFAGYEISGTWKDVRGGLKEAKNVLGLPELVIHSYKAFNSAATFVETPALCTGSDLFFKSLAVVTPICDATELWSNRISPLTDTMLSQVKQINAIALLIRLPYTIGKHIYTLGSEISLLQTPGLDAARITEGYTKICLTSLDLLKTGFAWACPTLSLFCPATAFVGLCILICSTLAVVFTIIAEFAKKMLL